MGFSIDTVLKGYEFRIIRSGKVENTEWMHLVVEHPDTCEQSKISVPVDLRPYVETLGLAKGDIIDLKVHANAGDKYSRISLIKVLRVVDTNGEVVELEL